MTLAVADLRFGELPRLMDKLSGAFLNVVRGSLAFFPLWGRKKLRHRFTDFPPGVPVKGQDLGSQARFLPNVHCLPVQEGRGVSSCKGEVCFLASFSWERLRAGGEQGDRGWDGWMASPVQWTWIWASSESWWCTGRSDRLQSMGSQSRTRLDDWTANSPEIQWPLLEVSNWYTKALEYHFSLFFKKWFSGIQVHILGISKSPKAIHLKFRIFSGKVSSDL